MNKFWLAAATLGSVSAAQAADLPVLRGSFTDGLTTTRVINWEGFYVGGQGGYGSSDADLSRMNKGVLSGLLDRTNIKEEMEVPDWSFPGGRKTSRSAGYGAFVGYNTQLEDVVFGLEMNYMHLHDSLGGTADSSKALFKTLSDNLEHHVSVDSSGGISISDMATFRARAAYAWGSFLPYMFGGFAVGNADITRSVLVQDIAIDPDTRAVISNARLPASEGLHSHLIYGYTFGLGVDMNLTGGLFMRAEWEYVRFTDQVDTSVNTARLGLGYKF